MKISTRARYGLRLAVALGAAYGTGPVLLGEIAHAEEISEKYLGQIIQALKASGLVRSHRGAHGGYELTRPPGDVSLRDVVEVLEGGLALVDCVEDSGQCGRTSRCVTHEVWERLSQALLHTLEETSLQDLVDRRSERMRGQNGQTAMYYI